MHNLSEALADALKHHQAGRVGQAETMYREILQREPEQPDALHMLGLVAAQLGQPEQALGYISRAIQRDPTPASYHRDLGNVLQEMSRFSEALRAYQEALRLDPACPEAYHKLAYTLTVLGRYDEAMKHHLEGVRLQPDCAAGFAGLASTLRAQGMYQEAMACYERALDLSPEDAAAHTGRATLWLQMGDYRRGWLEYEWRWRVKGYAGRRVEGPLWHGEPPAGRRILLDAEPGLSDTIQFIRYAAMLKNRGAVVLLECQPELSELLRQVPELSQVAAAGETLPRFDAHLPMLSLPRVFKTAVRDIPRTVPYLRVSREKAEAWRARLDGDGCRKVGLVWSGRPEDCGDRRCWLEAAELAPLARLRGVRFLSLQGREGEAVQPPEGLALEELGTQTRELTELAAAMLSLDLVIAVDCAAAHLAGALGIPVWTLLPHHAHWRWLLDREDSPWYPTMRLFRQAAPGEWRPVIERVAAALEQTACQ